MNILAIIVGVLFIYTILQDGFETVVLPRRVTRRFRLSRLFYMTTWVLWSSVARQMRSGNRRDLYLSYFGPLSLLLLLVFCASLLDARAGSPPSATELLRRHYRNQQVEELVRYLCEWERWCAELLESHLSYPVLTYYRSQHERQSWLAALTTILDTSSLFIVGFEGITAPTVRFTFAIARHAAVDLAQVYGIPPLNPKRNRLSPADFAQMRAALSEVGLRLQLGADAEQRLSEIRRMYEPFINALADHLLLNLPPWIIASRTVDDWQTSAWDHLAAWSPERLDEITHIIIDHRKKMPLARGHEHPHTHEHQGEQLSSDGNGRATSS